jgi:hypothetical protein
MPGQRQTAGTRARGSWLPRLAGIGVVVVLAAAGVTAYLLLLRPVARHEPVRLPTKVQSFQSVGLVARDALPGSSTGQLLQLLGPGGSPQFNPLSETQQQAGSPQWTADLMQGDSYIFIFLPTGQCLTANGKRGQPEVTLEHCNLSAAQRWRRTNATAQSQGHDFYQYANLGDSACLTESGELSGQVYGAALEACQAPAPPDQLIAFWWSSV